MQPCPLPFAIGAAARAARSLVPALVDGKADLHAALDYCRAMRIGAIGKLLLTARPAEFFGDLSRAVQAFTHFAKGARVPAGKASPLLDALACGDFAAAAAIGDAASVVHDPRVEYEDDFLYFRTLADLAAGRAPGDSCVARSTELRGAPDSRIDCCLALLQRDPAAFERSLRALVAHEALVFAELAAEERLDPDEEVTVATISVEGLALVQLAQRAGIAVAAELPRLPSLARRTDLRPELRADAWRHVEVFGLVA